MDQPNYKVIPLLHIFEDLPSAAYKRISVLRLFRPINLVHYQKDEIANIVFIKTRKAKNNQKTTLANIYNNKIDYF